MSNAVAFYICVYMRYTLPAVWITNLIDSLYKYFDVLIEYYKMIIIIKLKQIIFCTVHIRLANLVPVLVFGQYQ